MIKQEGQIATCEILTCRNPASKVFQIEAPRAYLLIPAKTLSLCNECYSKAVAKIYPDYELKRIFEIKENLKK